jgi:hypothetical protein
MAEPVVSDSGAASAQSEIRRSWYIKSVQSERVTVLVGSNQDVFRVPYDLLTQYSRDFKKLRDALNDSGDEIALPDVTKPTFEDFFIWLHAYEPNILRADGNESDFIDGALNLAVFAQKFKIYHLRNQASDVVRAALREGQWSITPEMISAVYKVAPAGSALRQLSFLGFVASEGQSDSTVWQEAFIDCPSLGWDYFQYKNGNKIYSEGIAAGGACRFHDHSDIRGWVVQDLSACPYPHGAPRLLPGESAVHDIVINTPRAEDEGALISAEDVAEPNVATELQQVDEPAVEATVDQPTESASAASAASACWASETTETAPVDTESQIFGPHEQPLVKEVVEDWRIKTKDAEPVEVENFPAVDESLQHTIRNARMQVDESHPVLSKVTVTRLPTLEEKKEPILEQGPVVVKSPNSEHVESVQDSVAMARADSVMSVVEQTGPKGKGKKKKGKKQSQGA